MRIFHGMGLALVAACSLSLAACEMGATRPATGVPVPIGQVATTADALGVPAPAAAANSTVLDEALALKVEAAYKASRSAMELAVDSGRLRGANATTAAAIDNRIYAGVQATRAAYRAGNADRYTTAAAEALNAVGDLLIAVGKGAGK